MRLSADPTGEIDKLVEALRAARSPWEKVKVLTKAWRTVRKLRPEERFMVAKHVGLEGAETFLERLGDPYRGVPTEDLLDIVRAADAQDYNRWKEIVSGLRRPEEREKLLRKGIEEVKGTLLEEPEPERTETAESPRVEEVPPPPPIEPIEVVERRVEEEPEAEPVEVVEEPGEEEPERVVEVEESEEETVEVAPLIEEDVAEEEVFGLEEEPTEEDLEAEPVPVEVTEETAREALSERLTASESLIYRLRHFRSLTEEMRALEVDELERLLECLPEGWARRRALTGLLKAGIPADFDDALSLIRNQERKWDRFWCLSALIESRSLTREEGRKILAVEDSPMVSRRLRLRLA